jgi:hypothetical protein
MSVLLGGRPHHAALVIVSTIEKGPEGEHVQGFLQGPDSLLGVLRD